MHYGLRKCGIGQWLLHLCLIAVWWFFIADRQQVAGQALLEPSSSGQTSREWDRYTVRNEDFSVLLPIAPAMSKYTRRLGSLSKSQVLRVIGAYAEGVVYAIHIYQKKESLADFITKSSLATGAFKRDLVVSGVRGKEYFLEDDLRKAVTQFFVAGDRIYVFHTVASRLVNPNVGITRFFESIRFERLDGGLAIVDGPGDEPTATLVVEGSESRILSGKEVTSKAIVVTKPEPNYTDDARSHQITGTVVMRCVFSSAGTVNSIRVISGLPFGLTERAFAAARQIKFIPAVRDGRFVSMWIQLEYNFNLY